MVFITMMVEMDIIKTMMARKDVKANSQELVLATPRPRMIIIKMIFVLMRMMLMVLIMLMMLIHQKLRQMAPI